MALNNDHGLQSETLLLHAGMLRSSFFETSPAIYMNSGYVYNRAEDAEQAFANPGQRFVYSRASNPNAVMFEQRMAALEGAEMCFATASGMAAVFASIACALKVGDRVVAPYALFNSCLYIFTDILPRFGIEVELLRDTDTATWAEALKRPARLVFFETPANPALDIVDIAEVSKLAHAAGATVIVDNVFATPLLQKPLELGADVVVYSATKHIDGQGRCNGGAILCNAEYGTLVAPFVRHTGPMLSQFNAWLLFQGLETLAVRMEAQCRGTDRIMAFLETAPAVKRLTYPFHHSHPQATIARRQMKHGGNLITLELAGKVEAFALMNALKLILISNNLGDARTLITHPRTTTHQRLNDEECRRCGIGDGTVRLSIGLENADDLVYDLRQAFETLHSLRENPVAA